MINIIDITPEQKNDIMSHRDWSTPFFGRISSRSGNRINVMFSHMPGETCKIAENYWQYSQCSFKGVGLSGMSFNVSKTYAVSGGNIMTIEIDPGVADLNQLQTGDRLFLDWDLLKLPEHYWTDGDYIVRAVLDAKTPGSKTIPNSFKGVFVQCRMDNHELNGNGRKEEGDGLEFPIIHYKKMNNGMLYPVNKAGNYEIAIGNAIHSAAMIKEELDPSPEAIPAEPIAGGSILRQKKKARKKAETDNAPDYEFMGTTYTNYKYEA